MRLVGYIRVSSVGGREGESFISPGVQRDQIERYAALKGYEVAEWIEDLDQSGAKASRPGFQRALELVETGEVDGVACAKLDRFARSVIDGREGLERVNKAGGILVLVSEGLDTNTPMGKAMFTILLAFAELELDRIRENWLVAKDRAIARGVSVSPHVKLGYRKRQDGRLEPDPDTSSVVQEIFRRRGAGESWRSICDHVQDAVPGKIGWGTSTVMAIVASRTYLGEVRHGDAVNPTAHEPLVTRAEWEAAQQATTLRAARGPGSLLAGIVRCAGCGYTMSREGGGRRPYWYYGCRKRHAGGICPNPCKITGPIADAHVEETFLAWLAAAEEPVAVGFDSKDPVADTISRLELAETELAAYRDLNLVSVIGAAAYRDGLVERARVVEEEQRELARIRRLFPPLLPPREIIDAWAGLGVEERRVILAASLDAVFVKRAHLSRRGTSVEDRVKVLFRGEGPDVLPGRVVSQLAPFGF